MLRASVICLVLFFCVCAASGAQDPWEPYTPPCVEREDVFAFTRKPAVKLVEKDKYEITFAVKGNCDVTVGIVNEKGVVVRHVASGVLGANAPAPFQKNSLKQTIYWSGKDDLGKYMKEPGKLKVRVMLGLKPVFDKRLGGTNPKHLPGTVAGMAAGPDGVYVISKCFSFGHSTIRKFDHDGTYIGTVYPPPAGLPESKLKGWSYIEYEPGKRAIQGTHMPDAVAGSTLFLPALDNDHATSWQPVVVGNRLAFTNGGYIYGSPGSFLHYIYTDGSTDLPGLKGTVLMKTRGAHRNVRMAASPDGKTLYFSNVRGAGSYGGNTGPSTVIYARSPDGNKPAELFVGTPGKPGADNAHLSDTRGIDTDAKGRVYVVDAVNNRIQVFAPEGSRGKYLKTIKVERPSFVFVHKKTGAIYVQHLARVKGQTVSRVTKLVSFDDPREEFHTDGIGGMVTLDSWSKKPRVWSTALIARVERETRMSVVIWEERGKKFEKVADFEAEARKDPAWFMKWPGYTGSDGRWYHADWH